MNEFVVAFSLLNIYFFGLVDLFVVVDRIDEGFIYFCILEIHKDICKSWMLKVSYFSYYVLEVLILFHFNDLRFP